ncbi:sulfonate transport system ATP-binding protein [Ancylobacter sp. 3268]|uniref:ATP-binding cassette domain-containing protein n=1 Tax=Ancylobacter sp. 3268 TaxID=2817752 RepID=UPI0028678FB3|nr:ATP-binding cassette domain-containing protein [Ancylobacter sp. 3268]MDR6953406.1 sulfonate transport system ATP-binding protein [Ancylobacter sp. 3268]
MTIAPSPSSFALPDTPRGLGLRLERVGRRFGAKVVLDQIDLAIPAGQFVTVVGKSGCGKSTLLRLIAGLDRPNSGRVQFDGSQEKPQDVAATRIMFQEPRLLPWERVLANVEIGLPSTVKGEARHARARAMLAEVGLADRAGDWPAVLSGGQRQRVALARALASGPRVLALDEPLGALDALTRIEMQGLLERLWREQGFTALLVTHDVAEALALADRVVLIDRGRIALDLDVDLPRPRRRGSTELARLEGHILDTLFST